MLDTNKWKKGEINKFLKILQDFVDDFIKICQPKSEEHMIYLSQALLHGINTVFTPNLVTKDCIPYPISEAKLGKGEVLWEATK